MRSARPEASDTWLKRCIRRDWDYRVLQSLLIGMLALAGGAWGDAPAELLISEYAEGSSLNKAVELYNGTGAAVDLSLGDYELEIYFNGSTSPGTTVDLSGVVSDGDVFVVADDGADPAILAQADQTSTASFFNGDDAVVLRKAGVVVDSLGQVGFDPGSEWGSGDVSTQDNTIRRKASVCAGDTVESDAFDPAPEWDGYALNTFDGLGAHSTSCTAEPPVAEPLLLTELVVTPTGGEFIEIFNPGGSPVDLSSYYLTDATFAAGGTFYYNIVTGVNAGGGGFSDFHARFPAGASIGPGEYQTIALPGSDAFFAEYGTEPTYELFEDGGSADSIPDMEEAFPGSINGQGGLTNSGEVVILYYWDGMSDLVADVDYALWGDKDEAVDKTGVAIDGPDGDATPSVYLPDTGVSSQDVVLGSSHAIGTSFQRLDLSEGTETQTGGNGVDGNDETSENLSFTWLSDEAPTPGAPTPTGWIVNEIHADPASDLSGDANGDGVRDATQDEFVEIANTTGAPQDISGWMLSDSVAVRHVFPAGTVVADGCVIVVFGGGTPVGVFGGAVVQVATSGALGLNNGGDSVILRDLSANPMASASYGVEGGDDQSLTRSPDLTGAFVKHTTAAPGVLFSPGTLADGTPFSGCTPPPFLEIFEIQGNGLSSPYEGMEVATSDNVVTALAYRSFFMQTPEARSDGDPYTSDGIYVYTGSTPAVAVGDRVQVIGQVQEYFGLTEISGSPSVVVLGSGEPLPAAVIFDATTPSTSPFLVPDLERFEGMLVSFDGMASGPTNAFGEVSVVIGHPRAFREPGILFPGIPGLPVWDGNPEVFDVDTDGLDSMSDIVFTGQAIAGHGPLTYTFNRYKVLPQWMVLGDAPDILRGVRGRQTGEFTVASLNMYRFFDDVDDPPTYDAQGGERDDFLVSTAEYQTRKAKFVDYILGVLDAPDVLAVQEVEKVEVLEAVAADIAALDPTVVYQAFLFEGNDIGTIDNGFLVRDTVAVDAVVQLGKDEVLTYDGSLLHDRPPLVLVGGYETEFGSFPIVVMTVHNRSLNNIDDPADGARVRQKRYEQAVSIAEKVQDLQSTHPEVHLVVNGDFNAFEFTDGYVDAVGQIAGDFEPGDNLVCSSNLCEDLVDPDLENRVLGLPEAERYSFIFEGSAEVFDHALTTRGLNPFVSGLEYARGNADAAADLLEVDTTLLRASDHDALVLFVAGDSDGDGIADDVDVCPSTVIPESVPTERLGVNRFALVDDDGIFDSIQPGQRRAAGLASGVPLNFFTVADTGGCSCEQIIEAQHLGKGHEKFGCSLGAMRNWVELVNP
jgi:predicted extracellular nuclease